MLFEFLHRHPYISLSLFSFLINIPFGFIRENSRKFSWKWFFWIHASIPFIVYGRSALHVSSALVPVNIALAVLGQTGGGLWCRKMRSLEEEERFQHVYVPDMNGREGMNDAEVAVVLLNMGGPRDLTGIRDYQLRLFSDPLLLRFPLSFIFQKMFAWLLTCARFRKTERRYQSIGGGSPIYESTLHQTRALADALKKRGRDIEVSFGFNYSRPLPKDVVEDVMKKKKKVILPLSLYPHYSKATTGSSVYYLKKAARRFSPGVRFCSSPEYYLREGYILAFCDRIGEQINSGESLEDFYLVFSAHSLPCYLIAEGDPYPFQVSQTVGAILSRLHRTTRWSLAYQSAVGPLPWLKPSVPDLMKALARRGIKKVLIVPISFVSDHLETLCDIDIEFRRTAGMLGIQDFRVTRAIECHPAFIQALADAVESVLPPLV